MSRDVVNDVSRLLVALNDGGLNDHDETYSELVKSASRLVRDLSIPSSKHDVEDSNSDEDDGCGTDNLIGIFNVDAFDRDGTRTSFVQEAPPPHQQESVHLEYRSMVARHPHQKIDIADIETHYARFSRRRNSFLHFFNVKWVVSLRGYSFLYVWINIEVFAYDVAQVVRVTIRQDSRNVWRRPDVC